jgi:hypothetical protein
MASSFDIAVYITDVLKYVAVPAAVFEFLSDEKKACVEHWIVTRLPKLLKYFAMTLLISVVLFFVLIHGQKWIVGAFLVIGLLIFIKELLFGYSDKSIFWNYIAPVVGVGLFFSVIERWVLPDSWIYTLGWPIEFATGIVNDLSFLESIFPEFETKAFVAEYRSFFQPTETIEGSGFWYHAGRVYAFSIHGFMLLLILFLDLAIIASFVTLAGLLIFFPFHLFIQLSKWLNQRFSLTESNIPLGAFFLWGIGETIAIGLSTYKIFH